MQLFNLVLGQKGAGSAFFQFPPAAQPYGAFSKGDGFAFNGQRWQVDDIFQSIANQPGGTLTTTSLVLVPYVPHALAGDDPVPWPWLKFEGDSYTGSVVAPGGPVYEGVGDDLQQALERAHDQIASRPERDFTISRVVAWGMQKGGFTEQRRAYVQVTEDEHAPFKPDRVTGKT